MSRIISSDVVGTLMFVAISIPKPGAAYLFRLNDWGEREAEKQRECARE